MVCFKCMITYITILTWQAAVIESEPDFRTVQFNQLLGSIYIIIWKVPSMYIENILKNKVK